MRRFGIKDGFVIDNFKKREYKIISYGHYHSDTFWIKTSAQVFFRVGLHIY